MILASENFSVARFFADFEHCAKTDAGVTRPTIGKSSEVITNSGAAIVGFSKEYFPSGATNFEYWTSPNAVDNVDALSRIVKSEEAANWQTFLFIAYLLIIVLLTQNQRTDYDAAKFTNQTVLTHRRRRSRKFLIESLVDSHFYQLSSPVLMLRI